MLKGHAITIEVRPARCCELHSDDWVLCKCGWEENSRNYSGSISGAILGHRLSIIEESIEKLNNKEKL